MTNPDQSSIRHSESHHIDTFRDDASSREGAPMTIETLPMIGQGTPRTNGALTTPGAQLYRPPMTTNVASVIAAIDARRPGLRLAKKHLLLFFIQGHHLAWGDEPLFPEALYVTNQGITVDDTTDDKATPITDEASLGTITNALVRYSGLSPADLRTLVQASQPWQLATRPGTEGRIEWAWLTDWFRRDDETDDPDDERPNRAEAAEAEAYLSARRRA